jgi:glycosyltransferase involved in cell wall biosynthesis
MNHRPRVLLLIPHLGGGGAERVMALLARGLSAEKYELHLGLITQAEAGGEGLPSGIQIHALGAPRVRVGALRLLRLVRRLKPSLILSGIFQLNFLVLLLRPFFPHGTRVLVRQNGTVSSALNFGGLPWTTRPLYRLLYRRADRVICQTRAMAVDLAQELGLPECRLAVLPNPVDVEEIRHSIGRNPAPQTAPGPHLLAVGRLSPEKGFDLLLRALASVRNDFPGVSLLIAGAGPEEATLKAERHALGLDEAVRFSGYLARPWSLFPEATLFVLPSRHEGLPNALLEAAAAGLPIVALPACEGLIELLQGQPGVWLAPEISAEALAASLLDALHALRPGERFAHPFVEAFRLDRAIQAYESLIDQSLRLEPPREC